MLDKGEENQGDASKKVEERLRDFGGIDDEGERSSQPPTNDASTHAGGNTTFNADRSTFRDAFTNCTFNGGSGYYQSDATKINFRKVSAEDLDQCWLNLYFEISQIEQLAGDLEEHRFLILSGEAELGKASVALLTAACIRKHNPDIEAVLLCRSLPAGVRADFEKMCGEEEGYRNQILVFKNAFSGGNQDLLRFTAQLMDPQQLGAVSEHLRRRGSFVVMTTEAKSLPGSLSCLQSVRMIPAPSSEQLVDCLRSLSEQLLARPQTGELSQEEVQSFVAESGTAVVSALKSFSRIGRFIPHLPAVIRRQVTFAEALESLQVLDHWLFIELPENFEAWCTLLALSLCSTAPTPSSIPWLQFAQLRNILRRFFQRELCHERQKRELPALCHGRWDLEQAHAEMLPDIHRVKFLDERTAEKVWDSLLGRGKDLLTLLLPLLRKLLKEEDVYSRWSAARALGRIGEIDPAYIVDPLIHQCIEEQDGELLGQLFQGIIGFKESKYSSGYLGYMRYLVASSRPEEAKTAIASLWHVALLESNFAMKSLKDAAQAKLKLQLTWLLEKAEAAREIEELIRALEDPDEISQSVRSLHRSARRQLAAEIVPPEARPILGAFRNTLTALFFSVLDEGALLGHLLGWMTSDPERLGPLVTFLFLSDDGIAFWLERSSPVRKAGSEAPEASHLLLSACSNRETAGLLLRFLEQTFTNLKAFPGLFHHFLQERLVSLLAAWAREGRAIDSLRSTVLDLLAGLYNSRTEVSDLILSLAQDASASPLTADLKALATEAILGKRPAQAASLS
jgi:hypothetical protein